MKSILKRESSLRNQKAKSVGTKQEIRVAFDETQNRYLQYTAQETPSRTRRITRAEAAKET